MCFIQNKVAVNTTTEVAHHNGGRHYHTTNYPGLICTQHGVEASTYGLCSVGMLELEVEVLKARLEEMERLINVWKGHDT